MLKVSSAYDVSNFQNIDRSVISGQEILSNFIIESFIYWQKVPLKSFSFPEISKKNGRTRAKCNHCGAIEKNLSVESVILPWLKHAAGK